MNIKMCKTALYTHLMVLQLASDDTEGVVHRVMIDVNLRQPLGGATGQPLLIAVVIHHDRGPRRNDRVLAATHNDIHE